MPPSEANYDETKVPLYSLPDPLTLASGEPVADAAVWTEVRRPEILQLFKTHVFGEMLGPLPGIRFVTTEEGEALSGRVLRRQVRVCFTDDNSGPSMDILLYRPADAAGPVPVFLGLNFFGNHSIQRDPAIHLNTRWMRAEAQNGIVNHRATFNSRGCLARRWPVAKIIARGYGLATMYCGDLDPDYDDGYQNGVHPLFYQEGQNQPAPDEWGAIGAWAWGLSRAVDYLQTDPDCDHERVAVLRPLAAGQDCAVGWGLRPALLPWSFPTIPAAAGAALSRRRYGETVARINHAFPHWFCDNFRRYNDAEDELPVDQHQLLALCAPRPLYVASAVEDRWADPRGEFLAALAADPVYRLRGTDGLPATQMPAVDQPVMGQIGYHIRSGGHDLAEYDWEQYLGFADRHLGR